MKGKHRRTKFCYAWIAFCSGCLFVFFIWGYSHRMTKANQQVFEESKIFHSKVNPSVRTLFNYFPDSVKIKNYCKRYFDQTSRGTNHPSFSFLSKQTRSLLILDIGGYHGTTAFPPVLCFPVLHRVISVEPVLQNQKQLLMFAERFGLNDSSFSWQLIRGAFSNITEASVIYLSRNQTNIASLSYSAVSAYNSTGKFISQPIHKFRGDDVLLKAGVQPDYIKIDVQGQEALVMQGLKEVLSENRNMLVFAEHSPHLITKQHIPVSLAFSIMISYSFKAYCEPKVRVENSMFIIGEDSKELLISEVLRGVPCGDIVYWKKGNSSVPIKR